MNTELADAAVYASAWRRLGAFVTDAFLLGLVGIVAGYFLFDILVDMGGWGRALGFFVALAYFATLNSRIGNGQTAGKRLLNVKVVGADGAPLPVGQGGVAFRRVGDCMVHQRRLVSCRSSESAWIYPLAVAVFGVGFSVVYLFLFNRPTRQSLHDLAVSSYVVRSESQASMAAAPLRRVH